MEMSGRWAWAEIDLDALHHNVGVLLERAAPAELWAVVKADGYGHGAVDVAAAALDAGAAGLCVALVQEGVQLRAAGINAPILLLSEQPPELADELIRYGLTPTVYRREFLDALVERHPVRLPVHLLVDTGMQRVGVHPHAARAMVAAIEQRAPAIELAGVYTHLAVADSDDPDHVAVTAGQLRALADVAAEIPAGPLVHVANSAGILGRPDARLSMVRAGIAMYGVSPGPGVDDMCGDLRPVMALRARVSYVKEVRAGSAISYGHRHRFTRNTTVATVPIGYADGVPRRLFAVGGEVLVGGTRCPIVGAVTMDQLMIDCGDLDVRVGDEVTLIGTQGDETIRAEDWADRLDTIGYEIVCGISSRVPRVRGRSIGSR